MKTVIVQIGNSDDKLTQVLWSKFAGHIRAIAVSHCSKMHFCGASLPFDLWQNACFVLEMDDDDIPGFKAGLSRCKNQYGQDSVAITIGDTEFV